MVMVLISFIAHPTALADSILACISMLSNIRKLSSVVESNRYLSFLCVQAERGSPFLKPGFANKKKNTDYRLGEE